MIHKEAVNRIQSISLALQGVLLGTLLIYPAQIKVHIFGVAWGLLFMPVIVILFWPRQASFSWSIVGVFLFGLVFDFVSDGPLGIWALSYILLYLALSARAKSSEGIARSIFIYALCVFAIFIIAVLLGRLSVGQWPQITILARNALASIFVFPFLYWIRMLFMAIRGKPVVAGNFG